MTEIIKKDTSTQLSEEQKQLAKKLLIKGTIQSFTQRPGIRISMIKAIKEALIPSSELKITCLNIEELVYCSTILGKTFEICKLLDTKGSCLKQLELTNGSCIKFEIEK